MTDPTTTSPVTLERDGGVAVVRLSRPEAMNALDIATKEALLATLREVADDESVRCVVLTGTGRAFCVGQDLKEHIRLMQEEGASLASTVVEHYNPIVELLATMDKPVVAAVNGVAAGAGASFAFAADLRILAASAGFNMAFTGIALSCDSGASYHLPRLVGTARAKELLLRPRTLSSAESLELGLASEVVADEEFEAHVRKVAQALAAGPTKAYGAVRRAVAYSAGHSLSESLAHEAELMNSTGATADHATAVAAFLAKEKPTFAGQ
ncbi:enoyl-CoA hydratase-related protein [Ornithinimicrobium sp. F0845]|uniref:enoyl-CoA hydratase/isomerase family protein n=1 Tax=Ornithinimicrobium sp. F0845 TaxID=2926412 RepID=UPI001FF14A37|nr:enoyl-CoA hydratase-related protein [Ornithinimicrobium sp. F0845]MCK0111065.1 enoyl-CoA hydratase-related protein [Ornithinimicrobium sp. F0845]